MLSNMHLFTVLKPAQATLRAVMAKGAIGLSISGY